MPFKKFWNLAPDHSDESVLNMYVYGEICSASSFFGSEDDVVASNFVSDLNKYPGIKTINVHINSPGGSVFAAASIINQLRKHPAEVHTYCDGICASAAVGILQAANPGCRHMSRATLLMIHNPSTRAQGDQKVFMKTADLLAKVKNTLVNIYHESTGLPEAELSDMMDAETYLDADEALAKNFADVITEDEASYEFRNEGTLVCNGLTMDVAATLNVEELKSHLQKLSAKTQKPEEGGSPNMNFEEYLASLAEDQRGVVQAMMESHMQAQIEAAVAPYQETAQTLNDQITSLTEQVTDLQSQLQSAQAVQTPPTEDPMANLPEDVKNMIAQARADAIAAQQALAQMQAENEFNDFKATFSIYDNLPIQDSHIKAMQILAKNQPDMFKDLGELLKVANVAMGKGFVPQGTDKGTDVAGNAWDTIENSVKAYQESHEGASYADALRAVLRENPELYDSYRQGMQSEL